MSLQTTTTITHGNLFAVTTTCMYNNFRCIFPRLFKVHFKLDLATCCCNIKYLDAALLPTPTHPFSHSLSLYYPFVTHCCGLIPFLDVTITKEHNKKWKESRNKKVVKYRPPPPSHLEFRNATMSNINISIHTHTHNTEHKL